MLATTINKPRHKCSHGCRVFSARQSLSNRRITSVMGIAIRLRKNTNWWIG